MPLTNILKSLDLPVMGKNFYRTEDQFIPSSSAFAMINGAVKTDATVPQEIIISCKNKRRRICGYLSEGVKLNGQSNWETLTQNSMMSQVVKPLGTANTLTQLGFGGSTNDGKAYSTGASLQQPWMNRKFWTGSNPFSLEFHFNFVAEQGAKEDVFMPAIALLSFIYPRSVSGTEVAKKLQDAWNQARETVAGAMGGTTTNVNTSGGPTIASALDNMVSNGWYSIPGPSLIYGAVSDEEDLGDTTTIVVGNMFAFGAVYLKTVNLEFSPNIDYSGYPTWCKCSVTAECMDTNICLPNGDFIISEIPDSSKAMAGMLRALTDTATTAAKDVANIAKATMNAIGYFPQLLK